jgi:hypothetical protein
VNRLLLCAKRFRRRCSQADDAIPARDAADSFFVGNAGGSTNADHAFTTQRDAKHSGIRALLRRRVTGRMLPVRHGIPGEFS